MITLKSISFTNIGPFLSGEQLSLESDVTVITGQNDAGKSLLLDLIERLSARDPQKGILETDVALAHKMVPSSLWKDDQQLRAHLVFCATKEQGGGDISANITCAPNCWKIDWSGRFSSVNGERDASRDYQRLNGWPQIVVIPSVVEDEIRHEIPLDKPTDSERALLRIAFQKDIHAAQYTNLSNLERRISLIKAQDRLNSRLAEFLPKTLSYRFTFDPPTEARPVVEVGLTDAYEGFSSLGQRGAGVRKMINLLGRLAIENIGTKPTLLLLDEPENSLHADAQHALRYALEQLGSTDNVQVIYATHSPAMINTMRPETIRMLRRIRKKDRAWSSFDNRPVLDNFAAVRTMLGVSPADSLLYAPVTILVEGATEALCLPRLLRRLCEEKVSNFDDVNRLLGNCVFVAVGGDHFGSQCALAKGFGVIPIAYADGDKAKLVRAQLRKDHSDVEIVTPIDQNHEAEDLVPRKVYFKALAKALKKSEEEVNEDKFLEWQRGVGLPEQMMISKRIGRWVEDNFDPNFSGKPDILFEACCEVPIQEIVTESLVRLVDAIRKSVAKAVRPFEDIALSINIDGKK